ncbi:MAG: GAF domain-containing sensor histidine kinase [SAR324 cluster bacterium]|nr:GAF domain-containing sensor histidine kinase [SAR324 cluster bacterium]
MKASQAISGEIKLERLLKKMLLVLIENSGAQKGIILLQDQGPWEIQAQHPAEQADTTVLQAIALDSQEAEKHLPKSIVLYVESTRESLVLEHAAHEKRFMNDPYVVAFQPKSLLCLPILYQKKIISILYLENNLMTNAFTPDRMETLEVLASQAAISLENSRLYTNLEEKVKQQTKELESAHEKMLILEKEATETQIAGGFAHEIKNALAGSKLVLEKKLGVSVRETKDSLSSQNCVELKAIYEMLDTSESTVIPQVMPHMKKIFANEQQIDKGLIIINKSIDRALNITRQIMDFSKIGKDETGTDPVSIDRVIENIAEEYREAFNKLSISIRLNLCHEVMIPGREVHFYSLFNNLVLNAKDAILEAKQDHALIEISSVRGEGHYCVSITDNGIGIPEENLPKIYDAFFSTKPEPGTGLGLGVVRKIVLLYQCAIDVNSELGKGCTFKITFPLINRS